MREQNALPYKSWITSKLTAKDDVDNVGAGRAAKGENPSLCAKKSRADCTNQPALFIVAVQPHKNINLLRLR